MLKIINFGNGIVGFFFFSSYMLNMHNEEFWVKVYLGFIFKYSSPLPTSQK